MTRGGPRPPTRIETSKALCFDEIKTAMTLKIPVFVVSGESCWDKSSGRAPKPPSKSVAHVHDTNAKAIAAASLEQYPDLKLNLSVSPTTRRETREEEKNERIQQMNAMNTINTINNTFKTISSPPQSNSSVGSTSPWSYAQIAGKGNSRRSSCIEPYQSMELDQDADYYEIERRLLSQLPL